MTERDRRYKELTDRLEKDPEHWVESMRIDFVEAVERMMEERGVSRAELARRLDSSPAYVTQMLKALFNPTLLTLAKVALALDARVELSLVPKDEPPGRRAAPLREPRRRERQQEFVAAERSSRAGRNDFIASDKPAKPQSRKP
ncbi:helix-turn-helix transcriptional regulator [candidate division WOR-3 bacterium]|nr:helix-turn-helix transcriptional regulator [candidate division WOR-3 bacterium]